LNAQTDPPRKDRWPGKRHLTSLASEVEEEKQSRSGKSYACINGGKWEKPDDDSSSWAYRRKKYVFCDSQKEQRNPEGGELFKKVLLSKRDLEMEQRRKQ